MNGKFNIIVALAAVAALSGCGGKNVKTEFISANEPVVDECSNDSITPPVDNNEAVIKIIPDTYSNENVIDSILQGDCVPEKYTAGKYNISFTVIDDYYGDSLLACYDGNKFVIRINCDMDSVIRQTNSILVDRRMVSDYAWVDDEYKNDNMYLSCYFKESRNDSLIFSIGMYKCDTDIGDDFELKFIDGKWEIVRVYYPWDSDDE